MKKLLFATLLIAPLAIQAGGSTDNSKTGVQNVGKEGSGEQTIFAIGDVKAFEISKDKVKDFETITKAKVVEVVLPKNPGAQAAYSFTPTTGESKGKLITIALDNDPQKPGTRLAGKSVVKFYRRFTDDMPKDKWTEIGKMTYDGKLSEVPGDIPVKITLKTDGTAVYRDRVTKKPTVFLAGTKDLSKAAAQEKAAEAEEEKQAAA